MKISEADSKFDFVAIKVIDYRRTSVDVTQKFVPRELTIACSVNHRNVLRIREEFKASNCHYIITDLARYDLLHYMRLKGALRETLARRLFFELCSGLTYLHHQDIVHRDLKCENLLIGIDGALRIADFGFSRQIEMDKKSSTFCGSPAYAAPEVLSAKQSYNPRLSDYWSCGIICYIMLTGKMPFTRYELQDICQTRKIIIDYPTEIQSKLTKESIEVVQSFLRYFPDERQKVENITKSHSWIKRSII